ncbi:hypothetical protein [Hippea jasoniae]|uniref:hypothetical protein n=1 Tax=Hippea jasoniae TaxID=944479 RepID=UPI0005570D8B|nr:hypothetical protein [Hippea jasoniae]
MRKIYLIVVIFTGLFTQLCFAFNRNIGYVGTFWGLEVKNFNISASDLKVGSKLHASFEITNITKHLIKTGKYGFFIACRNPDGKNRDFGHTYKSKFIKPHQTVKISATIKINKAGRWIFWPDISFPAGHWGPYQWRAITLNFSEHRNNKNKHHKKNKKQPSVLNISPPYLNCSGWRKTINPGRGSRALYFCNYNTGYLGILDQAILGGSTSEATQYIYFNSPKNGKVKVTATIYYTGGTKVVGLGAFAGLKVTARYKSHYKQKTVIPGLNYQIAAGKIIDLVLLAAPGISKPRDVEEALEMLDTINNVKSLLEGMQELYRAKKAKKITYIFYINAHKGGNIVGIGLRGNCSGVVTGSSFVITSAQLINVRIDFR